MKLFEFFEKWNLFTFFEKWNSVISSVGAIVIPLMLFNYQKAQDQAEDAEKAQAAVKAYLSQLSDIFLEGKLEGNLESKEAQRLRTAIRASTLALLKDPNLEGEHKGQIISYLIELKLIQERASERGPQSDRKDSGPVVSEGAVISLAGADLSGADLSGLDLNGADFKNVNLKKAKLFKTNFSGANLSVANFEGADSKNVNLKKAKLFKTNFSGANLSFADFEGAKIDSNFSDANLTGASFTNAKIDSNFSDANLTRASFTNADIFSSSKFSDANLRWADLTEAKGCINDPDFSVLAQHDKSFEGFIGSRMHADDPIDYCREPIIVGPMIIEPMIIEPGTDKSTKGKD